MKMDCTSLSWETNKKCAMKNSIHNLHFKASWVAFEGLFYCGLRIFKAPGETHGRPNINQRLHAANLTFFLAFYSSGAVVLHMYYLFFKKIALYFPRLGLRLVVFDLFAFRLWYYKYHFKDCFLQIPDMIICLSTKINRLIVGALLSFFAARWRFVAALRACSDSALWTASSN